MGEYFLIAMVIGSGFYIGWNCTRNILDMIGIGMQKWGNKTKQQLESEAKTEQKVKIGFDY